MTKLPDVAAGRGQIEGLTAARCPRCAEIMWSAELDELAGVCRTVGCASRDRLPRGGGAP